MCIAASALQLLGTEGQFKQVFDKLLTLCRNWTLIPQLYQDSVDHPSRLTGPVIVHMSETVVQHFRQIFFTIVDTASSQIYQKLNKNSPNMKIYLDLEQMLFTGKVNAEVCAQYPELSDTGSQAVELEMF